MSLPQDIKKSLETALKASSKSQDANPQIERIKQALVTIENLKPKEGRDYNVKLLLTGDDVAVALEGLTPMGRAFVQTIRDINSANYKKEKNDGEPAKSAEPTKPAEGDTSPGSDSGSNSTEHVI